MNHANLDLAKTSGPSEQMTVEEEDAELEREQPQLLADAKEWAFDCADEIPDDGLEVFILALRSHFPVVVLHRAERRAQKARECVMPQPAYFTSDLIRTQPADSRPFLCAMRAGEIRAVSDKVAYESLFPGEAE